MNKLGIGVRVLCVPPVETGRIVDGPFPPGQMYRQGAEQGILLVTTWSVELDSGLQYLFQESFLTPIDGGIEKEDVSTPAHTPADC